jgi:alpha-L-rhamnosidase
MDIHWQLLGRASIIVLKKHNIYIVYRYTFENNIETMRSVVVGFLFLLILLPCTVLAADIQVVNLKVEYTDKPLGIDVTHPRFSWQMVSSNNQRGCKQTAYQLVVTNERGDTVWNTEKIKSNVSLNILYSGKSLVATTRYNWAVTVWDQNNQKHSSTSWFETGLMNADARLSAWSGAKWVGGGDDDMVLYSQYLPVFRISYSLQLDEKAKATRAGFVYGANDMRLMDKYKNLYQLENKKDKSYILIELDIAPLLSKDNAKLNIYRVGYSLGDKKDIPFKSFSISPAIINDKNQYVLHTVSLSSNLGTTRIYIDGINKENLVADVNLNPLGRGGDFIAFPVVADVGFFVSKGQSAAFSNLEIRNFRSPSNIVFAEKLNLQNQQSIFSGLSNNLAINRNSYNISGGEGGSFIVANPSKNSMPMLRTSFSSSQSKIAKARLYITSRGIYEVYLNGRRIDDDYFNPGLTQYNKTHLYQAFDVTPYIHPGENALGALLAEGWWSGAATYMGEYWNYFGDRQSVLAKLVITYADGKEDVIVSNPSTWFYYNDGPIVYSSFFQGEVYNATKDSLVEGWSTSGYNASKWKHAQEVNVEGHVSTDSAWDRPGVNDYTHAKFIGQFGQTVKKIKELTALSVIEVRPKVFVYDMGQNIVGVPKIVLSGMEPNKKIVLRFAEVKYPDLAEYKDNIGMIMLENIRAAMAQDIYITKGGNETIHPRFTFHGYRFVEITGIDKPLPLEAVKGTVISSIDKLSSYYETSNPKVNKLWQNITWSTFGNFLSIPTDCPQRNERLGWSGDISVFSGTATYLANVPEFLRRHMLAMRDVQGKNGRFTDIAPLGGGFGGIIWGSAGITVAWESYQQYGDKQLLIEHYDAMKNYILYLQKHIDPKTGILTEGVLGDWLGPEQEKNDNALLWEAYFLYDLELMKKIASILGKKEDEKAFNQLRQQRTIFFNETYVDKQNKKTIHSGFKQYQTSRINKGDTIDTQTSYVLPLVFDIYAKENRQKAVKNFIATVARENKANNGYVCPPYSLMTGFIGTAWISKALSDNGHADVAYRLLQQTSYPSWLYSVEQGATTIWERLNSYTREAGFGGNNHMNSFNHYSFGAVGAWMYNYSLGIQRDENSPGFKHFILQPEPDHTKQMTYAKGYYESMYGKIESNWERKGDNYYYYFVVPANTTATLYLNAPSANAIIEKSKPLKKANEVRYLGQRNKKFVFKLQSGQYDIEVRANN